MTDRRIRNLGKRIRQLRKEKEFSQESLANQTKIDRSYMGQIERGERNISVQKLLHICDVLQISPAGLFENFEMKK